MGTCERSPSKTLLLIHGGLGEDMDAEQFWHRPGIFAALWPATNGDPAADAVVPPSARHLLGGDTIRGVRDCELQTIVVPTAVMGCQPENLIHSTRTVTSMVQLIPTATRLPDAFPEPPHPDFEPKLDRYMAALTRCLLRTDTWQT